MTANILNFQIQLPANAGAAAQLLGLQLEFVAAVTKAGGKVSVQEPPSSFEDLAIKRWIVDDCDTQAVTGMELLMSLGNVLDDADNIFGNVIFEDEHGVLNKVVTSFEFLQIADPENRGNLLSRFAAEAS